MNNGGRPVYKTSIFEVEEIDIDSEPYELSLKDLASGMLVIVDMSKGDFDSIHSAMIKEKDVIATSLMSVPNNLEVTGAWRLWGNVKKIG